MKQAWQHFLQYKPLLKELVRRDLKVKYRRSFLGYIWSLLNPLLMMCVMTLVFSYMFRFDIPNYPLYLITGQTLWTFFNESTNMSMYSVLQNGALIKKVYIPKFIFPISRVLSSFVTMSFSLVAILVVMVFSKSPFYWTILLFPVPLFFLLLFAMGIGMVLSALSVYFRDITHLYGVLTLAWMYLTPIFYPVSALPEEVLPVILGNPMYAYITFFREIVLYGTVPEPILWLKCVLISLTTLALGLVVFRKMQRNFILYI
ncbi:MAG: ABC transporter permease [Clostridia bacterium]|nr:ABC transporter permease [Clostridia bacterium]